MSTKPLKLEGQKFGRLTAIKFYGHNTSNKRTWLCKCECGNKIVAIGSNLVNGNTKSCGCLKAEEQSKRFKTHGHTIGRKISPTYHSWSGMIARCKNINHSSYYLYGALGISVCERWLNFENFLADMGEKPKGTSIDRIDSSKGYFKDNCRWATDSQQALNKKCIPKITYCGISKPYKEWADFLQISSANIRARLRLGWSLDEALGFKGFHPSEPNKRSQRESHIIT